MAGTGLDIGDFMERALKDKVNVMDPKALKDYAAGLKGVEIDPKVTGAIQGLDSKSKDTIADLSRSLGTDVGAITMAKVQALPAEAQRAIGEQWKRLTENPGNFFSNLIGGLKDLMTGNGPGARLVQGLVVGTGAGAVVFGAMQVADNLGGDKQRIGGMTPEQARQAMINGGQERTVNLNRATGALNDRARGYLDQVMDRQVDRGIQMAIDAAEPPRRSFIDKLRGENKGASAEQLNEMAKQFDPQLDALAKSGVAPPPPTKSEVHSADYAFSDEQWAQAKVETTVAVSTAQASAKTEAPPVAAPAAVAQGSKLPPKQVLAVPKGAKATDITKMLNENGLDRTQKGQNGPAIVNRKYYDTSKDQKPLELADAMQAEFRVARDAPRDPVPTVAKAKEYDPVKPSAFEMNYT